MPKRGAGKGNIGEWRKLVGERWKVIMISKSTDKNMELFDVIENVR